MLVQILRFGFRMGEISCPCRYNADCSSINFRRSVIYGTGVVKTSLQYALARRGWLRPSFLSPRGRDLFGRPIRPRRRASKRSTPARSPVS